MRRYEGSLLDAYSHRASKQLGAWSYAGVCTHAPTSGAVVIGVDGVSDFNALHSGKHEVQLCAFDVLALDGDDSGCASAPSPLTGPIAWAGPGQPRIARARSYRSC